MAHATQRSASGNAHVKTGRLVCPREYILPSNAKLPIAGTETSRHFVTLYINLEALGLLQCFDINEDWTAQQMLERTTSYLHIIGYFSCNEGWMCDVLWDDYSLLSLARVIAIHGGDQTCLLVKDLFFGGERLDVRIFTAGHEHVWNPKLLVFEPVPCAVLGTSSSTAETLAAAEFADDYINLEVTRMRLNYLLCQNWNLREHAAAHRGAMLWAVVHVGFGDIRLSVLKQYRYERKENDEGGYVEYVSGDVCGVRDKTGVKRLLKFRPNRGIWIEVQRQDC